MSAVLEASEIFHSPEITVSSFCYLWHCKINIDCTVGGKHSVG